MNRQTIAFLAVASLAACSSGVVREPPAPLVKFTSQAKVERVWRADTGSSAEDDLGLSPVLDGDKIYAGDSRGRVSAYTAADGRRLWRSRVRARVRGATGVGAGLVLVGTRDGEVIALAQETGVEAWRASIGSEVLAPPTAAGGVVVVQTGDGRLYGLSAVDGTQLWLQDRTEPGLSLRGTSAPIIAGDVVLTGFASGKITAVNLADGRALWDLPVAQPRGRNEVERLVDVDASLLIAGDTLYAVSYQGKLIAVQSRTGGIGWSRDVSSYTGMAADSVNVYVTDADGQVLAFDRATGASKWKQDQLKRRDLNAPAIVGGYLAVGDLEGHVHWLAREDGHLVARLRVSRAAIRAPGIAVDDALYVASQDGKLTALRIKP